MTSYTIIHQTEESTEYAAYIENRQVATASVLHGDDGAYCERIDVEEDMRNQGIGSDFLRFLSTTYGDIYVAPDNEDAQRLYDRLGFDVTDRDDWCYVDQGFGVYRI